MTCKFTVTDVDNLAGKLADLSQIRFDAVVEANMTQIYNRGMNGGTPVDTGELRNSLGQSGDEVGYTKSYAPHVEYGHRTRNGGYVEGQRYLYKNVETQRPLFREMLIKQLEEA